MEVMSQMAGHGRHADGPHAALLRGPVLKDEAMAEAITDHLAAVAPERPLVVHWCGRFHSDFGLGRWSAGAAPAGPRSRRRAAQARERRLRPGGRRRGDSSDHAALSVPRGSDERRSAAARIQSDWAAWHERSSPGLGQPTLVQGEPTAKPSSGADADDLHGRARDDLEGAGHPWDLTGRGLGLC